MPPLLEISRERTLLFYFSFPLKICENLRNLWEIKLRFHFIQRRI